MYKGRSLRYLNKFGKINLPPRDLLKMVGVIKYRMNSFVSYVQSMNEIVPREGTEFREQFDDIVPWPVENGAAALGRVAERIKEDFDHSLEYFADSPLGPGFNSLMSAFERFNEFYRRDLSYPVEKINEGLPRLKENIETYKGTDYYPKYVMAAASKMYSIAARLDAMLKSLYSIFTYVEPLKNYKERQGKGYYGEDGLRGDDEPIELLYHATVNAANIYADGFKSDIPSTGGLGGSQSDKGDNQSISFTGDLYHAKEIMRAFKEVILLMQGKYSPEMLLRHIRSDPGGETILKSFKMNFGRLIPKSKEELFDLYRTYLALSVKRYNPVFFGDSKKFVQTFETANYNEVGIVVASVDMTNPDIKYLDAMREYRVPPSAVIKIEKVIK